MKVTTLDPEPLREACCRLARQAGGFAPDIVVGIATGGAYVGRIVAEELAAAAYVEVSLQRAGTERKSRLRPVLRLLPRRVADYLRLREARHLERRGAQEKHFDVPQDAAARLQGARRILIVDDAADSGATLKAVAEGVERCVGQQAEVKSAVLTVTQSRPLIEPDFALWRDGTLLRFPWSSDYR